MNNIECTREPQVIEWIKRLGEMTAMALATQEDLAMRISPILRIEPNDGVLGIGENELQLVPLAHDLRAICMEVGRIIERNQELTRKIEI